MRVAFSATKCVKRQLHEIIITRNDIACSNISADLYDSLLPMHSVIFFTVVWNGQRY